MTGRSDPETPDHQHTNPSDGAFPGQLFKKPAGQLLLAELPPPAAGAETSVSELETAVQERLKDVPPAARSGVSVVVPDPDLRPDASGSVAGRERALGAMRGR